MTKATSTTASLLLTTALLLFMGGSAAAQSGENSRYRQFRDTAAASISNPSTGNVRLFFDSTGFYWKNSAGVATAVGGGGFTLTQYNIPMAATTTTLGDSKMQASGTNSGTWTLYDSTASTGASQLFVRTGPGQSTTSQLLIGSTSTGLFESAAGILKVTDGSTGSGGIGISDAATATVTDALILRHATSDAGFGQDGFGTGLLFQGEDDAGNMQSMGSIDFSYSDSGNGSEDSRIDFSVYQAGSEVPAVFLLPNTVSGSNSLHLEAPSSHMYFSVGGTDRWLISSSIVGALVPLADNAYDFGYSGGQIKDAYLGTSIQGTRTKTGLTADTATGFVTLSCATDSSVSGYVEYTIFASDTTAQQSRTGKVYFSAVAEGTTVTAGTPAIVGTEVTALTTGTLDNDGFTVTTGTNAFTLLVDTDSSLTETVLKIDYRVVITSGTATVTPL